MQCSYCHAPLPQRGMVCPYCQQNNTLNLRSIGETEKIQTEQTLLCPLCEIPLSRHRHANAVCFDHCERCDGLFIEEDNLLSCVESYAEKHSKIDSSKIKRFIMENPRNNHKDITYHKCPYCTLPMKHIMYKKVSGIHLDICEEHGIWIDGGELKQIFEWTQVS